jgi:polyisoprenoid-binding protein YceI
VNARLLLRAGVFGGLLLAATATHAATAWTTDPAQSRLEFTAILAGGEFDGAFRRFQADIDFDPADLEHSRFRVEIALASADTGDADRDLALRGADFFAVERWPSAGFAADRFVALGNGRFEALGRLTIRDNSREVRLPFRFEPAAGGTRAGLAGGTTIRRLDYGVGQGEWQDTQWLGDEVRIRFTLQLQRQKTTSP